MRWRILVLAVCVVLGSAGQAGAALCFVVTPGPITLLLELQGQPAGAFFNLVGVADFGSGAVVPLNGSAYLRQDGMAHFGVMIHSSALQGMGGIGQDIGAWTIWGLLNPAAFTSGSGLMHVTDQGGTAVLFTPASCPSLP